MPTFPAGADVPCIHQQVSGSLGEERQGEQLDDDETRRSKEQDVPQVFTTQQLTTAPRQREG